MVTAMQSLITDAITGSSLSPSEEGKSLRAVVQTEISSSGSELREKTLGQQPVYSRTNAGKIDALTRDEPLRLFKQDLECQENCEVSASWYVHTFLH